MWSFTRPILASFINKKQIKRKKKENKIDTFLSNIRIIQFSRITNFYNKIIIINDKLLFYLKKKAIIFNWQSLLRVQE